MKKIVDQDYPLNEPRRNRFNATRPSGRKIRTKITAEWLNGVQDELLALAGGESPNNDSASQNIERRFHRPLAKISAVYKNEGFYPRNPDQSVYNFLGHRAGELFYWRNSLKRTNSDAARMIINFETLVPALVCFHILSWIKSPSIFETSENAKIKVVSDPTNQIGLPEYSDTKKEQNSRSTPFQWFQLRPRPGNFPLIVDLSYKVSHYAMIVAWEMEL